MIFQTEVNKELQFLAYLIPVIIGIQLAMYFFYQYHKIRDKSLPLNRILLAFGSFILFIILGPLFIQISRNFIENVILDEIISRIGWFLAFFSTISVSFVIITKDFSQIINIKIAKILMILNFIPIVILFLVPSLVSLLFIISIFFVVLNGLYIIRFQIILIRKSLGMIKKKLKLFLLGALVSFFSLFFATLVGLGVLPPIVNELIYFMGILNLLLGFIIISLAVYNFPPFYEFEWRDNLLKLFIINPQNKNCLYSFDFVKTFENKSLKHQDYPTNFDKFFSKGIIGIDIITKTITGIKDKRINKIKKGDLYIFLEYGPPPFYITFVLIVKIDLISTRHVLKTIKSRFESFFKEILLNLENLSNEHLQLFRNFDIFMNQILQ